MSAATTAPVLDPIFRDYINYVTAKGGVRSTIRNVERPCILMQQWLDAQGIRAADVTKANL
jgi:hypothetical protein